MLVVLSINALSCECSLHCASPHVSLVEYIVQLVFGCTPAAYMCVCGGGAVTPICTQLVSSYIPFFGRTSLPNILCLWNTHFIYSFVTFSVAFGLFCNHVVFESVLPCVLGVSLLAHTTDKLTYISVLIAWNIVLFCAGLLICVLPLFGVFPSLLWEKGCISVFPPHPCSCSLFWYVLSVSYYRIIAKVYCNRVILTLNFNDLNTYHGEL